MWMGAYDVGGALIFGGVRGDGERRGTLLFVPSCVLLCVPQAGVRIMGITDEEKVEERMKRMVD